MTEHTAQELQETLHTAPGFSHLTTHLSYIRPAPGPGTLSAPNLTQYVSQWKGSTGTTGVVLWPLYTGSNLQDIQPKPISPFPPPGSFALSPKPVFQVHGNDPICKQ